MIFCKAKQLNLSEALVVEIQPTMKLGDQKTTIERFLGRDIAHEQNMYSLQSLPEHIIDELNLIGTTHKKGLLALLYLHYLTNASLSDLKDFGGASGWLHGEIE